MKIRNPKLLSEYRTPGPCWYCGKFCRVREPAHVFSKGSGHLDIRANLAALGSTPNFQCSCHTDSHNGKEPTHYDLLTIVSARIGFLQDDITDVIYLLRRLPKDARPWMVDKERETLTVAGGRLLDMTLEELT